MPRLNRERQRPFTVADAHDSGGQAHIPVTLRVPHGMDEPAAVKKRRARRIDAALGRAHPDAHCALVHHSPLQLLIATILSAQCTDERVNRVTPALFAAFPDAAAFANGDRRTIEKLIQSAGFFRTKAKNIQECCRLIVERHQGEVPGTLAELVQLPGVGRKTANVVLGECFGVPGITVDTHVGRLSRRMGLTAHDDPVKVETDLMALLPAARWTLFNHRMIFHGRRVCAARKPLCDACMVRRDCPRIGVE